MIPGTAGKDVTLIGEHQRAVDAIPWSAEPHFLEAPSGREVFLIDMPSRPEGGIRPVQAVAETWMSRSLQITSKCSLNLAERLRAIGSSPSTPRSIG